MAVDRVTNNWRAVQLISFLIESCGDIVSLETDSPAWNVACKVEHEIIRRLLAIVCRREPTVDEIESITRGDCTEDYDKLVKLIRSGADEQTVTEALDTMIKEWE